MLKTAQNPNYAPCYKRAFVMCGKTAEVQKALLNESDKIFSCHPDSEDDRVCVTYVRIDARTHLKTRETVSVICVAPLMSWWGVEITPSVLNKYRAEGDLKGWRQYVSQAGHGQGWNPLYPLPVNVTAHFLANEVVPRGQGGKPWFREGDNIHEGAKGVVRIGNERGPPLPEPGRSA